MGALPGLGAPDWRMFGGVSVAPSFDPNMRDTDKDGVVDALDRCIREPEDLDQFQDEDGCPEVDNDADGLRDPVDRVTRDPARKLGWEDRLLGSMKLARAAGVTPEGLAEGARLALLLACEEMEWSSPGQALDELWKGVPLEEQAVFRELLVSSPS